MHRKKLGHTPSDFRRPTNSEELRANINRKLAAYSAVAAAVLSAGDAMAQCTNTNPTGIPENRSLNGPICVTEYVPFLTAAGSTRNIDFDGNSNAAARIRGFASTSDTGVGDHGYIFGDIDGGTDVFGGAIQGSAGYAMILNPTNAPSTFAVSAGQTFTGGNSFFYNVGAGEWPIGRTGEVGVEFTRSGNTHFGWIRVRHSATIPGRMEILKAAYNTVVGASITAGDEGVLPVELTTFGATTEATSAVLVWTTATETNNAGFEIQVNGPVDDAFQVAGFVPGAGSVVSERQYNFRVEQLDPGVNIFRLKQVDFDGSFSYSGEVEVSVEIPGTHAVGKVYPNPLAGAGRFTLSVAETQEVQVALYNLVGQLVKIVHDGAIQGETTNLIELDISSVPAGQYHVRVIGRTFEDAFAVSVVR